MITTVYFVRHAESDYSIKDDVLRPLTKKGEVDTKHIIEFFEDKEINVILSSPFKRAIDTIKPYSDKKRINIELIEDFRERKIGSWIEDFNKFAQMQWEDFDYKLKDGQSLKDVQKRNIVALEKAINTHKGKNIIVGSHGTALSTVINYYDSTYGYKDFQSMKKIMPWIVKLTFESGSIKSIEKIDILSNVGKN
jgi:2,3-bisphosphoglycerate-dependent phosphoglycerate mutase